MAPSHHGKAGSALGGGPDGWSFWIALGILVGAFTMVLYGTISVVRTFRLARVPAAPSGAAA